MKYWLKNHWQKVVIIILILALIWFVILPRYNAIIYTNGYNWALNDLANTKQVPLLISQQQDNETITQIIPVPICSQEFQQNYQKICGG